MTKRLFRLLWAYPLGVSSDTSTYRPGACNIGTAERKRRYALGVAGLAVAAAGTVAVFAGVLPRELVPALFAPLAVGVEGVLQGSRSFCAVLAVLGRYSFGDHEAGRVEDPANRRADRTSAVRLTATSVVVAAVATAVVYALV